MDNLSFWDSEQAHTPPQQSLSNFRMFMFLSNAIGCPRLLGVCVYDTIGQDATIPLYVAVFSPWPPCRPCTPTAPSLRVFNGRVYIIIRHDARDDDDDDDDRPRRRRGRGRRADDLDKDTEPTPSGWDASGWFSGAQQANQGGLFDWARRCVLLVVSLWAVRGLMNQPGLSCECYHYRSCYFLFWCQAFTCACPSRRTCPFSVRALGEQCEAKMPDGGVRSNELVGQLCVFSDDSFHGRSVPSCKGRPLLCVSWRSKNRRRGRLCVRK